MNSETPPTRSSTHQRFLVLLFMKERFLLCFWSHPENNFSEEMLGCVVLLFAAGGGCAWVESGSVHGQLV